MKYIRRQEVGAIQWLGDNLEEIKEVIPASDSFEIEMETVTENSIDSNFLIITKIGYVGGSEIVHPNEWIVWDQHTYISNFCNY